MSKRISLYKLSGEGRMTTSKSEFEDSLTFETNLEYEKYKVKLFSIRTKNKDGNFILDNDNVVYGAEFFIDGELVLTLEDSFTKLLRHADTEQAAHFMHHAIKEIKQQETQGEQQ